MIAIAKKRNVVDTALEDPKDLKCGDAARKLALDVKDLITAKQKVSLVSLVRFFDLQLLANVILTSFSSRFFKVLQKQKK